ncbi:MAG: inositol monophosphatase [bacterium]|jgi:myo-inositol-1(or 4)-monophosphatase
MATVAEILHEALDAGGRVLRRYGNGGAAKDVRHKDEINLVTAADLESEREIVAIIRRAFPDHAILTEESGEVTGDTAGEGPVWVIDPLDGTTNFAHGFPIYCVSIGYLENGMPVAGGVYDPTRNELFFAERGKGATLNGNSISVSASVPLERALLATGFPYDIKTSSENNLDLFFAFALRAQAVRRAGSAALDLCYLACGRFDGFWELKLHPWDTAAGWLLIEEAGGFVSDFAGAPFEIFKRECAAANSGVLLGEILEVISRTRERQGE